MQYMYTHLIAINTHLQATNICNQLSCDQNCFINYFVVCYLNFKIGSKLYSLNINFILVTPWYYSHQLPLSNYFKKMRFVLSFFKDWFSTRVKILIIRDLKRIILAIAEYWTNGTNGSLKVLLTPHV